MQATEYNEMIQSGYKNSDIHESQPNNSKNELWIKYVAHQMKIRNIEMLNNDTLELTTNQTIMDYVQIFKTRKKLLTRTIDMINHVRLFKKLMLPFELFGLQGNKETETCQNNNQKSAI